MFTRSSAKRSFLFIFYFEITGLFKPNDENNLNIKNLNITGTSSNNIKIVLEDQQKALEDCQRTFGENHPETALVLEKIAEIYGTIEDYPKALEYHDRVLKIKLNLFGESHCEAAAALNKIGVVYTTLGDCKKALQYEERALKIQICLFLRKSL